MNDYPYKAFVLTAGFNIQEVKVTGPYGYSDYQQTAKGKPYRRSELFDSPRSAVDEGLKRLDEQELAIAKRYKAVQKRRSAIMKAQWGLGDDV